jgi:hypothetical protein
MALSSLADLPPSVAPGTVRSTNATGASPWHRWRFDVPVGIISEEPLAPLVVLLPVFFLGGRCCIILHLGWIVIVVLLGGL